MPLVTDFDAFWRGSAPSQAPASQPLKRNLFLRIVDAIGEANRRKAEREIARYIARNGGRLTDQLEHDIARQFGSGHSETAS